MPEDTINAGNYTPITRALREYIERHPTMMHAVGLTDLCDNIDAIHKALERENEDMQKLLSKAFEEDGPTDERDSALRDRAERQSKRQEARGGEPVLVEVAIPLECIEIVRCDFNGIYHVQVFGKDVVTDKETYQRVVEARDAHLRRMRELGMELER